MPSASREERVSGTWIVSPHHDDAALSLAAAINLGVLPAPVRVANVFTVSNYSVPRRSLRHTSRMRAAEDRDFADAGGVVAVNLSLRDAAVRPGIGLSGVFGQELEVDSVLLAQVTRRLCAAAPDLADSVLVLPAGLGGHIDHRTCAALADAGLGTQVLIYADQPYASENSDAIPRLIERYGEPMWTATASPGVVRIKADAARFYPSQPAAQQLIDTMEGAGVGQILEVLWRYVPRL